MSRSEEVVWHLMKKQSHLGSTCSCSVSRTRVGLGSEWSRQFYFVSLFVAFEHSVPPGTPRSLPSTPHKSISGSRFNHSNQNNGLGGWEIEWACDLLEDFMKNGRSSWSGPKKSLERASSFIIISCYCQMSVSQRQPFIWKARVSGDEIVFLHASLSALSQQPALSTRHSEMEVIFIAHPPYLCPKLIRSLELSGRALRKHFHRRMIYRSTNTQNGKTT